MSFEDELRTTFRRADGSLEREALDWHATINRGRARRMMQFVAMGATVLVLAVAGFAVTRVDLGGGNEPVTPVGPSETTTPTPDAPEVLTPPDDLDRTECSAARRAEPVSAQTLLPEGARRMRADIIEAAWGCDYERLAELTGLQEGEPFSYSLGADGDPAEYWRTLEESVSAGEPVMERLVQVLSLPPAEQRIGATVDGPREDAFVWPRAHGEGEITDEEWAELEGIYEPQLLNDMRENGSYLGYRVAITADGDWLLFTAGD